MQRYNEHLEIPRIELAKDYTVSRILKGGWQLAGGHGAINREQAIEDMFVFVKAGITTFDFGDIYTGVEELVGEFLRRYKKRFGPRSTNDIQLHTKFVPDLDALATITKKDVERGIDRSLIRLGVDTLDLVQFHWWDYDAPRYIETGRYLRELQKAEKIRYLGVTNFDVPRLQEFSEAGVTFISHQVQYSLLDHRPEHGIVEFCKKHNIKLLCYGTIAGGFLSEKYRGATEPHEPLENRSLTKYKLIIDDFGGWELFQELLSILSKIAEKHGVSIANIATRYVLEKPQVAGIIIGARDATHLEDTQKLFGFALDEEDKKLIEAVIAKSKGPQGDTYSLERVKGGRHAAIMKYNLNTKS